MPQTRPQQARGGWIIQVGAYPSEAEAKQRLASVKSKGGKLLAGTEAFTESVSKGSTVFYRARFAGFDKDRAEEVCKSLKLSDVECVTIEVEPPPSNSSGPVALGRSPAMEALLNLVRCPLAPLPLGNSSIPL